MSRPSRQEAQPRYIPGRQIGWGGCAGIYEGKDTVTLETVAIKKYIHGEVKPEDILQERNINREIQRQYGGHPNIVAYRGSFGPPASPMLVFEKCEGGDVSHHYQGTKCSEADAVLIIRGAMFALEFLHQRRIFQGDIKPENLLFKSRGSLETVAICDFGSSRKLESSSGTVNPPVGAVFYQPPEAFTAKKVGIKADIWDVGIIMHELLTGEFPFDIGGKRKLRDIEVAIQKEELHIRAGNTLYSGLSQECLDLLDKLLTKDPYQRPTATEALQQAWLRVRPRGGDHDRGRELYSQSTSQMTSSGHRHNGTTRSRRLTQSTNEVARGRSSSASRDAQERGAAVGRPRERSSSRRDSESAASALPSTSYQSALPMLPKHQDPYKKQ